jgi:transcriptional regulator GlxA family with amidase domain
MKTIAITLFPDVLLLDVTGPTAVFSMANRNIAANERYKIVTCGVGKEPVRSSCGMLVTPDFDMGELPKDLDLLLVPGGPGAYNDDQHELIQWLSRHGWAVSRYGAICTGAFILGKAGLLDGHRCTTHWNYLERLREQFPKAIVEPGELYVKDQGVLTTGGVTAGIDLAIAIVAEDHGKTLAVHVAKVLLVAANRQGGQAPYKPLLATIARDGSPIGNVKAYIADHIQEAFSVQRMAEIANMSIRTFNRVFQRETGATPIQYLQDARIEHARRLLENTDLVLKSVAARAGFTDARHMRNAFNDRLGISPAQYRSSFGES